MSRAGWTPWLLGAALLGCPAAPKDDAGRPAVQKSAAVDRAERRAYDGAPPVIPHPNLGAECVGCHHTRGVQIEGLGYAPPSPHEKTSGLSERSRCTQCHLFRQSQDLFRASQFAGLTQNLQKGERLYDGAPPVIPHDVLMRENCAACHDGPAAREVIRTPHPERVRCRQCHLAVSREGTTLAGPAR